MAIVASEKKWRVWVALLAAPAVLAAAFGTCAGYFAVASDLRGEALAKAVESAAPLPGILGFTLVALFSIRLARSDGLTLASLGWARPSLADSAIGLRTWRGTLWPGAIAHVLASLGPKVWSVISSPPATP